MESDHRILVYRYKNSDGKSRKAYGMTVNMEPDDNSGSIIMRVNEIVNVGVVITRWSGGINLGPYRFKIMEKHFQHITNPLDEN